MMLMLSIGFGLGVLATALAGMPLRKRKPPIGYGTWSSGAGYLVGDGNLTATFGKVDK